MHTPCRGMQIVKPANKPRVINTYLCKFLVFCWCSHLFDMHSFDLLEALKRCWVLNSYLRRLLVFCWVVLFLFFFNKFASILFIWTHISFKRTKESFHSLPDGTECSLTLLQRPCVRHRLSLGSYFCFGGRQDAGGARAKGEQVDLKTARSSHDFINVFYSFVEADFWWVVGFKRGFLCSCFWHLKSLALEIHGSNPSAMVKLSYWGDFPTKFECFFFFWVQFSDSAFKQFNMIWDCETNCKECVSCRSA